MQPIISLHGVLKKFKTKYTETTALNGVDFSIFAGEFVSVVGRSGSGKSTLVNLLGLIDKPDAGEIKYKQANVSDKTFNERSKIRNEDISVVFQQFLLVDEINVFENVALPLRYRQPSIDETTIITRVEKALNSVGLASRQKDYVSQLSGGEQQRIAIARSLVIEPTLLILDEPTGNLDSSTGDEIMELLTDKHAEGLSICLITHDENYASKAQKRFGISDGKITCFQN